MIDVADSDDLSDWDGELDQADFENRVDLEKWADRLAPALAERN